MRLGPLNISWGRNRSETTKAIVSADINKSYGGYRMPVYYSPPNPILTALGGNANACSLLGDPRSKFLTYRMMAAAFPEVSRMLWYHLLIMGCPTIASEDQVFADEANARLRELKWMEQLTYEGNDRKGLEPLIRRIVGEAMTVGQGFYTIQDTQGNEVTKANQRVDSIRFHDSERFCYHESEIDRFQLQYTERGLVTLDKRITPGFRSVRVDSFSAYPWGKPLLHNIEATSLEAAILSESQKSVYRMKNAPRMTAISLKPMLDSKDASIPAAEIARKSQMAWDEAAKLIRETYSKEIERFQGGAIGGDIVQSLLGETKIDTHSLADKINPVDTYPEDIQQALKRLVYGIHGEPSLVGLGGSGDGMNSHRSELQMAAMAAYGQGLRSIIEPHCNHIFMSFMAREATRIPDYKWSWEGVGTTDLKAQAEVDQIRANAQNTWVTAMNTLLMAGEVDAAQRFAMENDLDWFMGEDNIL